VARRRSGRRSQRRLGTEYHTTARCVRFSLTPAGGRWQARGSRLLAALLLAAIGWIVYTLFDSPNFYVYGADVQGNGVVTPDEVYVASELEGMSIFWVDPATIATRVERLPNVRSAWVKARLPARVTITIEERTPELVWQTGDAQWWIDAESTVVPPRADLPGALTIVDTDAQPVSPGQQLDPSILGAAYALHQLLPELAVVFYSQATGISFTTREGWPVYLGDGHDMDAKLTILVAMHQELLARGVSPEFIDVRFVERPFYQSRQ